MRERQFLQCQHFNCLLDNGVSNQSVPIVLAITDEDKARVAGSKAFTLTYEGKAVAILRDPEIYAHQKEERCARTWGLANPGHPYVKVRWFHYLVPIQAYTISKLGAITAVPFLVKIGETKLVQISSSIILNLLPLENHGLRQLARRR